MTMSIRSRSARRRSIPAWAAELALAGGLAGCTGHPPEPLEVDYEALEAPGRHAGARPSPSDPPPSDGLLIRVPPVREDLPFTVEMAKPRFHGFIAQHVVRRVVRAHLDEVRGCYGQGLARDPALTGHVTLRFTIDGAGDVDIVEVADASIADGRVVECITAAVRAWRFPEPDDGRAVAVEYPFVLSPMPEPGPTPGELRAQKAGLEAFLAGQRTPPADDERTTTK